MLPGQQGLFTEDVVQGLAAGVVSGVVNGQGLLQLQRLDTGLQSGGLIGAQLIQNLFMEFIILMYIYKLDKILRI